MSIVLIILVAMVYLLPSIVACSNKKSNAAAITVLNLLLGWSGIGYIVALVWACTRDSKPDIIRVFEENHPHTMGYVRAKK